VSISSDDDTNSTIVSHGEYDSENDSDVDMHMKDDVDAHYWVDLDGDVAMERDGDIEVQENEEQEDEEVEDEEVEDEENDDEDEEKDEAVEECKKPRTVGQGEMLHTSYDDVQTMVNDQPFVVPEHGLEMREQTTQPHPGAPAPWPQTPEPRP